MPYNEMVKCVNGKTDLKQVKSAYLSVFCVLSLWVGYTCSATDDVIPYCIDPNWLPYEAIEDSQHIGLSSDYIKILATNTNYNFKLIKTKNWQQSLEFLQSGECMLLPMLNQTPERDQYIDFSEVYFSSPNFLVSTLEKPYVKSINAIGQRSLGLTAGYRITEYIKTTHPDINTTIFETEVLGLQALADGKIDFFIGSMHSVNSHIQSLGLTNLKFAGWGGPDDALRMGVIKGQKTFLTEINQVLNQITQKQHFEIYNRWNDVTVIDNTNYKLIWQISLAGIFILALVLVRYISMRKYNHALTTKNRQLSELQMKLLKSNAELKNINQHDALTGLHNRHHFNQFIADESNHSKQKRPLSIIIIDLDFFKSINDTYGHLVGDEVLMLLGKILKHCCDEGELVSRWGGEEFVILKQPGDLVAAEQLCNKIRFVMKRQKFPHGKPLTCSFGVAELKEDEQIADCFERADIMLFKAKESGRNRICVAEDKT